MNSLIFHLFFFSLFISYTTAHSKQQEEELFKQQLYQLIQPNYGVPQRECPHCLQYPEKENVLIQEQESELFQQCAVDLCGPANKSPKYAFLNNTPYEINPEATQEFYEQLRPAIRQAIKAQMENNRTALKDFENKFMDPASNLNPQEWDEIFETLYKDYIQTTYSQNGLKYRLVQQPPLPPPSSQEGAAILSYINNKNKRTSSSTAGKLADLDLSVSEKRFLTQQYQDFLREYKNNRTRFTEYDAEEITRLGQKLKGSNYFDYEDFAETLDNLRKKSKGISFCTEEKCKNLIQTKLQSLHRALTTPMSSPYNQEEYLNRYLRECQAKYNVSIGDAQSATVYRENLDEYKKKFLNAVFTNSESQSGKFYQNYMNTIHFNLPRPGQDIVQSMLQNIKDNSAAKVDNKTSLSKFVERNKEFQEVIQSICPSPVEFESDSFSPFANTLNISNFSCMFHEHGKQTLAHELGHTLSHWFNTHKPHDQPNNPSAITYQEYMKLRECASKRRTINNAPKPRRDRFLHDGDKWRTEEDVADLIAYKVFPDDPTPAECFILRPSDDGSKYKGLKILYPPSKNRYITDTHSTPLLRAIMEAIHKRKKLSFACQKIVNMYSDRINFEPCF